MNRATKTEAEAAKNYSLSQSELDQSSAVRAEAESYRTTVLAEVDKEAKEYIDLAKSTIDRSACPLGLKLHKKLNVSWDR